MHDIREYAEFTGKEEIEELFLLARNVENRRILNVNSTSVGGGVAEILLRMVPLIRQLGIDMRWSVIKGDDRFFNITKRMHNALHGVDIHLSEEEYDYFIQINRKNMEMIDLDNDINFIHDPQPVALIEKRDSVKGKWLWRCHIDFTTPQEDVFNFIKNDVKRYDAAIFSSQSFARNINATEILISPSIDPLSDKNRRLPLKQIESILARFNIDTTRPIITQISRFDYLKDPIGVIKVYKQVKRKYDIQLVLAGGGAKDDPEGEKVLQDVKEAANGDSDIHIILLPPGSDIEINALQSASTVVLQKSLREGFGLTVAEALWKEKAVIASAVGGIPLQIKHKFSGILTYNIDGTIYYLNKLLSNPEYIAFLGKNGKEHIRENYLITRHIRDYLMTFIYLLKPEAIYGCQ